MRNPVARHDFNRASVHEDKKKSWQPDEQEGISEWEECKEEIDEIIPSENPQLANNADFMSSLYELCCGEYTRGLKASGIC